MQRFLEAFTEGSENECWMWQGSKDYQGYGVIKIAGKLLRAHRLSYEYYNGQAPVKECICHTCDTPACVNPNHLIDDTKRRNRRDQIERGRDPNRKLTDEQVCALRAEHDSTLFPLGQKKVWIARKAQELGVAYKYIQGIIYRIERNV